MCSSDVLAVNFFFDPPPDAWNLGMRLAPLCRTTGAQTQLMITFKAERWTSAESCNYHCLLLSFKMLRFQKTSI